MFNLGPGEIAVLLLLSVILLGPARLPELARLVRPRAPVRMARRWSWIDWLLVCAAALSFTIALAVVVGAPR